MFYRTQVCWNDLTTEVGNITQPMKIVFFLYLVKPTLCLPSIHFKLKLKSNEDSTPFTI